MKADPSELFYETERMTQYIPTGEGHQRMTQELWRDELERACYEILPAPTRVGRNRDLRLAEREERQALAAKAVRKDMRKVGRLEKHARGEATWDDILGGIVFIFCVVALTITLFHVAFTGHWNPLTGLGNPFGGPGQAQIREAREAALKRLEDQRRAERQYLKALEEISRAGAPGPPGDDGS